MIEKEFGWIDCALALIESALPLTERTLAWIGDEFPLIEGTFARIEGVLALIELLPHINAIIFDKNREVTGTMRHHKGATES
ncbi:hypothetical protein JNUCC1_02398 [Lentibacillus sp. JNUCC-1]|nr:hypothetical protein [Lentibacillus sp. JNUCC-1]